MKVKSRGSIDAEFMEDVEVGCPGKDTKGNEHENAVWQGKAGGEGGFDGGVHLF